MLSDEGILILVNELVKHNELEEIDISNNIIKRMNDFNIP